MGGQFFMFPGGKGANQAVASARLIDKGARVTFITKLGTDIFGDQSLDGFKTTGINTQYVFRDSKHASGVAMITASANFSLLKTSSQS